VVLCLSGPKPAAYIRNTAPMPRTAMVRPLREYWEVAPLVPTGVVVPEGVAVVVTLELLGVVPEATAEAEAEGTATEEDP
jgi:hypothetical protein